MKAISIPCFLVMFAAVCAGQPMPLVLQTRTPANLKVSAKEAWEARQTAIIVCDMWDLHTSPNAMRREKEMVPRMNALLEKARAAGALIIHAPSACMKAYEGTPARERAKTAPAARRVPSRMDQWCRQIPSEAGAIYPIDQSDGGADDEPATHAAWAQEVAARGLDPRRPWTRQIEGLRIDAEKDAISDSGVEIWNLLEERGIQNVILVGVHVNMCVSGRPFGLRQMVRTGRNVVLMRDLTDGMYNPRRWPFVSHARGVELYIEHVERHICPTITSDQILGGEPFAFSAATAGEKRVQVLLLGDSTTEAKFPKLLLAEEPQLEDTIRILLAAEGSLPPVDVVNLGLSGEYIQRLLESGRYDKEVAKRPGADFVFIRYGLNDLARRENFEENFPKDLRRLIERLRKDHPRATIAAMTVIPYKSEESGKKINDLIKRVAAEEKLPLLDIYPPYAEELAKGGNMLNYRRYPLAKVPAELRGLAQPYIYPAGSAEKDAQIVVLDNRMDAIFGHLPGWFDDRHPNMAGYNVIAREMAGFLRERMKRRVKGEE